jgi:hypothetical protein
VLEERDCIRPHTLPYGVLKSTLKRHIQGSEYCCNSRCVIIRLIQNFPVVGSSISQSSQKVTMNFIPNPWIQSMDCLLEHNALYSGGKSGTFRNNKLLSFSGSKSKPRMQQDLLYRNGSNVLLRNVSTLRNYGVSRLCSSPWVLYTIVRTLQKPRNQVILSCMHHLLKPLDFTRVNLYHTTWCRMSENNVSVVTALRASNHGIYSTSSL